MEACAQPSARRRAGFLASLLEDAHDKTQPVPLTPCFCTHAAVAITANILRLDHASICLDESLDMFCGDAGDAAATRNASDQEAAPRQLERLAACGRLSHQCLLNVLKCADFLDIEEIRHTALLEVMERILMGTLPADLCSDVFVLDSLLAVVINRTQLFHSEWKASQAFRKGDEEVRPGACGTRLFDGCCTCARQRPIGELPGFERVCDFCLFAHAGSPFRVLTMLVKRGIFAGEGRVLDMLLHDRAIASQCHYYYAPGVAGQGWVVRQKSTQCGKCRRDNCSKVCSLFSQIFIVLCFEFLNAADRLTSEIVSPIPAGKKLMSVSIFFLLLQNQTAPRTSWERSKRSCSSCLSLSKNLSPSASVSPSCRPSTVTEGTTQVLKSSLDPLSEL